MQVETIPHEELGKCIVLLSVNMIGATPTNTFGTYREACGIRVPIMTYNPSMRFQNLLGQMLEWQGGPSPPKDTPVPSVTTNSLTETVIAGVVSSIGILSTIVFLIFNLCYSKHPVVKRSSYRLNSLILVAVFVGFVGTLLHVIKLDEDMSEVVTTTICNARVWSNELAFVVAFGALFAKVWRLYKVFFNKKLLYRKYLSDKYLFLMVAAMVVPVLLALIVQVATFPLTLHAVRTVNEEDFSTENIYYECRGTHAFVFLAISYAEDGILALLSILVAYETQKHIPKYDKLYKYHESAVINLTTILAVLLSSVCQAVVIMFHLNEQQEGVLLVITVRDCLWMFPMIYLLFIPKFYRVYRGSYTKGFTLPHQISAVGYLITSARSSFSSVLEGQNSNVSILSSLEKRPSFQTRRRSSDSSILSDTGSTARPSSSNNTCKRKVIFSPIHEHNEDELSVSEVLESHSKYVTEDTDLSATAYVQFIEEPKTVTRLLYKSTDV
ncbi:gamma-aminobutyric acid type B receptor subunit 2-like [Dysidea avara]|uniref:gamma-aminobutyric acid type B receptor subunit 2-like n=1 Tax=Dysidea avara TaxID=196820 RepID=UPI0033281C9D